MSNEFATYRHRRVPDNGKRYECIYCWDDMAPGE